MGAVRQPFDASDRSEMKEKAWGGGGGEGPTEPKDDNTPEPGATLNRMLTDAEELLSHLIETCRCELTKDEQALSQMIIAARRGDETAWNKATSGELLAALAWLSNRVAPVTAKTLEVCKDDTKFVLKNYWIGTIALGLVILSLSVVSFMTAGMSRSIATSIGGANELAVRLVSQIGVAGVPSPTGEAGAFRIGLTDLQAFASSTRSIYQRAKLLDNLNPYFEPWDPKILPAKLQLPVPLSDPREAASAMIERYQEIRDYAEMVRSYTELLYGAVGTIILPILYAILGALANLLRLFAKQVKERSYAASYAEYAYFLTAAIAGMVVGLFSKVFVGEGVSLPPLAIAFVAGYATDFFFSQLDSILQRRATPRVGRSPDADRGGTIQRRRVTVSTPAELSHD